MSDDVLLTYKRVGEAYEGAINIPSTKHEVDLFTFQGYSFASMMMETHRILVQFPGAGLHIKRTDRPGLLPAQLEPRLLELLRTDPVAYIKTNSVPDRVIDLRSDRKSALAINDSAHIPRTGSNLRHGLDTLADAFGETLLSRCKANRAGQPETTHWLFEHPATGRWSDLNTIKHWLGSNDVEVQVVDVAKGFLLIKTELLLKTKATRFYYPREWNEFGSWITKEQLRTKLEKFRKDKANVTR